MADEPFSDPPQIGTDAPDGVAGGEVPARETFAPDPDAPEAPEAPAREAADDRPQLSHLLLWITCCAVTLALGHYAQNPFGTKSPPGDIEWIVASTVIGTTVMGLVLAVSRRVRRRLVEPGHWLLAAQGACYASGLPLMGLVANTHGFAPLSMLSPALAAALVLMASSFDRGIAGGWRFVLGLAIGLSLLALGLVTILPASLSGHNDYWGRFGEQLFALFIIDGILFLAGVIIVSLKDWGQRRPHGWLHRVGIAVTLLTAFGLPILIALGY